MKTMVSSMWTSPSGARHLVAVHTTQEPSDAEWSEYVGRVRELYAAGETQNNGLIFTDGAAPNVKQRKQLNEAFPPNSLKVRGAIISESTFVRGVVTALSWINPNLRSFSPRRPREAFAHLNIKPEDMPLLMEHLRGLAVSLPECKTLRFVVDQRTTA